MSTLTTETNEVWTVIRYDSLGYSSEVGDFISEDDAVRRAREEVADYIEKFNKYYFCKIEHRIIPIYK